MSHIHLLADDFRSDKRPAMLVKNALEAIAETSKWKYAGAQSEKPAPVTDYSLRELIDHRLQQKIDRREKQGESFEYQEKEGVLSEIQTFSNANYDRGNYVVDFKALAK
jgi:hypothetical protein